MKNQASSSARSILATLALGAGLAVAVVGCSSTSSDRAGEGTSTQSETMTAAPGSMVTPMMTTAPMTTTAPMMTTAP